MVEGNTVGVLCFKHVIFKVKIIYLIAFARVLYKVYISGHFVAHKKLTFMPDGALVTYEFNTFTISFSAAICPS